MLSTCLLGLLSVRVSSWWLYTKVPSRKSSSGTLADCDKCSLISLATLLKFTHHGEVVLRVAASGSSDDG